LVEEVLRQFEVRGDAEVSVRSELPENLAPIEADAVKLKQVLTNLVDNAIRFTQKGSVTVHVDTEATGGTPVRIDVVDTGSGIPHERLSHIFEPFRQPQGEPADDNGGSGLGLAISKSLCDLMNYRLSVRSHPNLGSTFSVFLPTESRQLPLSA
jgi:signal transduction histidine kinase